MSQYKVKLIGKSRVAKKRFVPSLPDNVQETDHEDDCHFVYISTPPSTHYELTMAFLRKGKHVICEKPLCYSSGQAGELLIEASRRGLALMESFPILHHSQWTFLNGIIPTAKTLFMRFTADVFNEGWRNLPSNLGCIGDFAVYPIAIAVHIVRNAASSLVIKDYKSVGGVPYYLKAILNFSGLCPIGVEVGYAKNFCSSCVIEAGSERYEAMKAFNPGADEPVLIKVRNKASYVFTDDHWKAMISDFASSMSLGYQEDRNLVYRAKTVERILGAIPEPNNLQIGNGQK